MRFVKRKPQREAEVFCVRIMPYSEPIAVCSWRSLQRLLGFPSGLQR